MNKDPDILEINGIEIKRGERKSLEIIVARLFDTTDMKIPVKVIRGKEPGPVIFISAAIHGDEINGTEVIRRLISRKKILSKLKGTIIAVPIVNVFGFNRNVRYLPDRRDLNRVFPGSKDGSLASQIAYKFINEIVAKCDYGVDLHTGSAHRYNYPQIRAHMTSQTLKDLAGTFAMPVVINSKTREGSLRQAAKDIGVKVILFEGGEANRYDERIIRPAEKGVFAFMNKLGMLNDDIVQSKLPAKKTSIYASSSHWIRATHSGSMIAKKHTGNKVKAGDLLGVISDPLGTEKHFIKAKKDGIIVGMTLLPLVNNGDALFHIAVFDPKNKQNKKARK